MDEVTTARPAVIRSMQGAVARLTLNRPAQRNALSVAGSRLGEANVDITFRAHYILGRERDQALVNLLLMAPGERTLVFTRTRQTALRR